MSKNIFEFVCSLKTIKDVIIHANKIIKIMERSFDIDQICKISVNDDVSNQNNSESYEPKHVISGSKAVTTFLELLREAQKKALTDGVKGCGPFLKLADHYKASDTDIFFLDCKEISRIKYENIDIIHLQIPNIKQHLDNFDLSCCKTSMNMEGTTFWVSLHCLYTMLTGNCFIPKYYESPDKYRSVYNKANGISPKEGFKLFLESKNNKIDKCDLMFTRTKERIEKYKERGYTFQYIQTEIALPCIYSNYMNSYVGTDECLPCIIPNLT